jgi:hypothetical protein
MAVSGRRIVIVTMLAAAARRWRAIADAIKKQH